MVLKYCRLALLCWSILLTLQMESAHGGKKVSLEKKIESLEKSVKSTQGALTDHNENAQNQAKSNSESDTSAIESIKLMQKQLETLKSFQSRINPGLKTEISLASMSGDPCQPNSADISENTLENLLKVTQVLNRGIPAAELVNLIEFIENNKRNCKEDRELHFKFEAGGKKRFFKINVIKGPSFSVDQKCTVYIDTRVPLGQGGRHTVYDIYEYGTWNNLAKAVITVRDDVESKAHQKQELDILDQITKFLPSIGLAEINKVNKYGIFMKKYEMSWADLTDSSRSKENKPIQLNQSQKLKLLYQLSLGLETLHSHKISHNDIKPENIMINFPDKAVYVDFEFSTDLAQLLKEGRPKPQSGNQESQTPEALFDWHGKTDDEKIVNALKADVFSQGLVAYAMFIDPKLFPLHFEDRSCYKSFVNFQRCKHEKFEAMITKEKSNSPESDNPLRQLIFDAIQPDVTQRVTAHEFRTRLEKYIDVD